jgi:hypothetical protein
VFFFFSTIVSHLRTYEWWLVGVEFQSTPLGDGSASNEITVFVDGSNEHH